MNQKRYSMYKIAMLWLVFVRAMYVLQLHILLMYALNLYPMNQNRQFMYKVAVTQLVNSQAYICATTANYTVQSLIEAASYKINTGELPEVQR